MKLTELKGFGPHTVQTLKVGQNGTTAGYCTTLKFAVLFGVGLVGRTAQDLRSIRPPEVSISYGGTMLSLAEAETVLSFTGLSPPVCTDCKRLLNTRLESEEQV